MQNLDSLECPICLQSCNHPIILECGHIFCFLCAKGFCLISKKCALCRHEISIDSLTNGKIIDLTKIQERYQSIKNDYHWLYEGQGGWWLYEDQNNDVIEKNLRDMKFLFEIMIAGNIYVIDLINMVQYRKTEPYKRRKMKRDKCCAVPTKGVAGIKISDPSANEEAINLHGDGSHSNLDNDSNEEIPSTSRDIQ
ncbi:unnamed protein product [Gordionus sp. m RMFG-2023]|uniref:E3 ubiquitin-protein ligase rnf146-like n=1 Tax=Gordionus sp. m RMFG-2023 TaxID=3053472 RepID=UPI0030DE6C3C